MSRRIWVAVVVLGSVLVPLAVAPTTAVAASACDAEHPAGKVTQAPTLTQTFAPGGEVVAAWWEVRLLFTAPFSGDLTSRLVFSPDPPLDAGARLEGTELATVSAPVSAAAGERRWIRFTPPEPVASAGFPVSGDHGIQLDFDYPDGPVHWAECGAPYDGGSAYVSETFVTSGAGLGGLPTVVRLASSDVDLAFRVG